MNIEFEVKYYSIHNWRIVLNICRGRKQYNFIKMGAEAARIHILNTPDESAL